MDDQLLKYFVEKTDARFDKLDARLDDLEEKILSLRLFNAKLLSGAVVVSLLVSFVFHVLELYLQS